MCASRVLGVSAYVWFVGFSLLLLAAGGCCEELLQIFLNSVESGVDGQCGNIGMLA